MIWATRGQLVALGLTLRWRRGLRRRDDRLDWIERRLGRRLDSSAELSRTEARRLLRNLQHERPSHDRHDARREPGRLGC